MALFIYIDGGYVNLDVIDKVEQKRNGRYRLFSKGKLIDDNNVEFERCIVSTIVVPGWECLLLCEGDKENFDNIVSEPLIAWGRTALGDMKPITPTEPDGVEGDYVVRQVGSSRVYEGFGGNIGGWNDVNDWLKYLASHRKSVA